MRLPEVLAPLRRRNFRLYWFAQAIAFITGWMQQMALGWLVTELSPRAMDLGLTHLLAGVPLVLLSLYAGALADRLQKRRILIVTQIAELGLVVALVALLYTRQVALWHIFVLSALNGTAAAFEWPAAEAMPAELVEPPEIARAVALMKQLTHGSRLVGPALGGIMVERFGNESPFVVRAVSLVVVLGSLVVIRTRALAQDVDPDAVASAAPEANALRELWLFIRREPTIRALLVLLILLSGLVFPFILVLIVYYVRHVLGSDDAAVVGALISGSAIGSVLAAVSLLWGSDASQRWWLLCGVLGAAAGLCLMASAPSVTFAALCAPLLAGSVTILTGRVAQMSQVLSPDRMRGRLMGVINVIGVVVTTIAGVLIAWLADRIGFMRVMVFAGAAFAVASVALLIRSWGTLASPSTAAQKAP